MWTESRSLARVFLASLLAAAFGLAFDIAFENRIAASAFSERQARKDRIDREPAEARLAGPTVLGIDGTRFTVNGQATFLLGISDFGALGAPEDFVRQDLDDLKRHGFNYLRVWATCGLFDQQISAVTDEGRPREPFLRKLKRLVADSDRRGLVVDITLTRAEGKPRAGLANIDAHERAVETIVSALREHRNWYIDLANERDVRDERYVSAAELKRLRALVRRLDPSRLVTASCGGHDLDLADLRESLLIAGLDFVTPHRPRNRESPGQTESRTRDCLALMKRIGRLVPVNYQEPFRRGYGGWEPSATDFLTDLRGAQAGGAAGWCFHNGPTRDKPENRPRRSFDLRDQRLFVQLDDVEQKVVEHIALEVRR
jgi:hypothetical protein